MRLLFSRSASPHHGFAAYYTYLERIFKVHCAMQFGMQSICFATNVSLHVVCCLHCVVLPVLSGPVADQGCALPCMQADAVLHFGTHGSLEFMPGKQVGMSGVCYPDSLIGDLPNLYYYAANNPSEATIAKRRSYANTISYLTPPAENAGLYKGLKVCSPALPCSMF